MNKFKQCAYTIMLIVICVVLSPMIYKQIWENSVEKKSTAAEKRPQIDIHSSGVPGQTVTVPGGTSPVVTEPVSSDSSDIVTNPSATDSADNQGSETPEATEPADQPITFYNKSDPSYFDDALFIGDSRTVGLRDYGYLKNADYYCDVGLAASTLSEGDLNSVLSQKNYGKVYIMLGINEVGNDFEVTLSHYSRIVSDIRESLPDAVIYLVANLHVTEASQTPYISNERLNYLNSRIAGFADYNKRIFYIDINPFFDDENGNLRSDCTGDGIHVYAMYYPTWCDWLCENTVWAIGVVGEN